MGIIVALVIIAVLVLASYCSHVMALAVSKPLKKRGSRWATVVEIVAFLLCLTLFAMGILLVFALNFSR